MSDDRAEEKSRSPGDHPKERATDAGITGWIMRNVVTIVVGYLVAMATLTGGGLALVAIREAASAEAAASALRKDAREDRRSSVALCREVNVAIANQRWKFRTDASLYKRIATIAAPVTVELLRARAGDLRRRRNVVERVACEKEFGQRGEAKRDSEGEGQR